MFKMVWDSPDVPAEGHAGIVPLGKAHAAQALPLAELTHPGPFGPRTVELGDYVGFFDGDRLVAMAGERMRAAPLREISGVCTHPDFRGRGLARMLVSALVARQVARGETPFLHVVTENVSARRIYSGMGFRDYREVPLRYLARTG